jgi:putative flippase GtrA
MVRRFSLATSKIVNPREFLRFVLTGLTATVGNLAAVWTARQFVPFEIALLAGIGAGLTVSFTLSKLFAFESRSWRGAKGEAARFLLVYGASSGVYWLVAVVVRRVAMAQGLSQSLAVFGGVIVGAGTMMVTSYLGHRFFTYRTHHLGARAEGVP